MCGKDAQFASLSAAYNGAFDRPQRRVQRRRHAALLLLRGGRPVFFHCREDVSCPPVLRDKGQKERLINRLKYRLTDASSPQSLARTPEDTDKTTRTRDRAQRTLKGQNNTQYYINRAGKETTPSLHTSGRDACAAVIIIYYIRHYNYDLNAFICICIVSEFDFFCLQTKSSNQLMN